GNHAGTDVTLFRSVGGSFAKVAKKQLSSTCTAKFTQRVRRSTVFQTRWSKQDDDHLGGKSRKKAVRVRR
ncbi:MAG TPA: hypothetical protein VNC78_03000, partial [Actinomycetota bacterium]|nr:hypothetical protein [Actinomycetota bacterium]